MTSLEKALVQAAIAFVASFQAHGEPVEKPSKGPESQGDGGLAYDNGIPVCTIHGKKLALSKSPRNPGKDDYYCQTKNEATGKWCHVKAGRP